MLCAEFLSLALALLCWESPSSIALVEGTADAFWSTGCDGQRGGQRGCGGEVGDLSRPSGGGTAGAELRPPDLESPQHVSCVRGCTFMP